VFEFRKGPVFTNLLLGDEINRATPKTQSALLEAMQEWQVTVEGERFALERPFLVIATQNPIEFEGTYPLPEAQLDRFIMRTSIGYPSADDEYEILRRRQERKEDTLDLKPVVSKEELLAMQFALEDVHVSEPIGKYIVDLTRATREDSKVQVGASPRGVYALFKLARAHAVLDNRDFVTPEDVKDVAVIGLAHRIVMKPEYWVRGISDESIVQDAMNEVPTPQADA
jgi:MoxR-like ATPase